jgi:large subunit ribosomal protein L7/L12
MNDTCICEKCGAEMKPLSDIYPVGMTCPNCGWGWATTYIDPINLDEINYHVILLSSGNSLSNIKMVSETANCNYVEAKKMINNAPVEVFHGQAVEVKAIKEKLEEAGIDFRIEPEFPY